MKRWNVLSQIDDLSKLLDVLLKNRDVKTKTQKEEFLNPLPLKNYMKKFPLEFRKSLRDGKELVERCMSEGVSIIIYGDYDSDGINATAILYDTLKSELGYESTFYFIPNRFEHSYGLTNAAVDAALVSAESPEKALFITVDSGITAVETVSYIKNLGHEIILTDHHQKPDQMPEADVVIWNDELVGAMVSWVFSRILGSKSSTSLALAALATVTDLYPVLGVNRSVVKKGLEILNSTPPLGLQKLLQVSGRRSKEVTTYDLGWVLGPRLNASGRLEEASASLQLVLEKDPKIAEELALKLHGVNAERQDKTLEMYALASHVDENNLPKVIVSAHEDYHEGIIGLVASRLVQKYYRPSIVISLNDGFGKGSVRSVAGINIIEILRKFENLFESLGGHPMAAGFTIKRENIEELEKGLLKVFAKEVSEDLLTPVLDIDAEIPVSLVGPKLLETLDKLKPFGLGNKEPVFTSSGLRVESISYVGKGKEHVSLKLSEGGAGGTHKAIFFNGKDLVSELGVGDTVDVAYSVSRNEFNGRVYTDLVVKDLKIK
jgi:single-stranded-DNA-specific exonuclease